MNSAFGTQSYRPAIMPARAAQGMGNKLPAARAPGARPRSLGSSQDYSAESARHCLLPAISRVRAGASGTVRPGPGRPFTHSCIRRRFFHHRTVEIGAGEKKKLLKAESPACFVWGLIRHRTHGQTRRGQSSSRPSTGQRGWCGPGSGSCTGYQSVRRAVRAQPGKWKKKLPRCALLSFCDADSFPFAIFHGLDDSVG